MTALRFTTKSLTGCVLVTVSGELDIATKPELIHYVNNILSTRVGMVVLDLSGITFIDAQGLSALIMIKRQAQLVHTELVLAGTPPIVLSLLRITRLDKHFRAFPQMATADYLRLVDHLPERSTAEPSEKPSMAGQSRI
ncbi:anti-anti-sigma factor [Streptosporangium subroseum]|uniref:Anti-sigma factor antagonist n=1 Tax=Streptosporangium subroseum TaxID=106412 RepID=A0A239P3S0_9ACTN|nr:STAS domain-containing protein [Streptosporangium subroseum]SNT61781.1 anti-anti-sigma factor [Streptosporangium subroseum]